MGIKSLFSQQKKVIIAHIYKGYLSGSEYMAVISLEG